MTNQIGLVTPDLLGRRMRHDPRSLAYPAPRASGRWLRSRMWRHYGPTLYQTIGSCTGHAMAQWLNYGGGHRVRGQYADDPLAMKFYSRATELDPWPGQYPPTDTGSSGLAVAQAAQEFGYITRYEHAFGLDHALQAIPLSPVLAGTVWTDDMFYPDKDGFVHPTGNEAGGHEWVIFGVNFRSQFVWAQNHWRDWGLSTNGKHSIFKVSFADLDTLLKRDGDVTVPVV